MLVFLCEIFHVYSEFLSALNMQFLYA